RRGRGHRLPRRGADLPAATAHRPTAGGVRVVARPALGGRLDRGAGGAAVRRRRPGGGDRRPPGAGRARRRRRRGPQPRPGCPQGPRRAGAGRLARHRRCGLGRRTDRLRRAGGATPGTAGLRWQLPGDRAAVGAARRGRAGGRRHRGPDGPRAGRDPDRGGHRLPRCPVLRPAAAPGPDMTAAATHDPGPEQSDHVVVARDIGVTVPGAHRRRPSVLLAGVDLTAAPGEWLTIVGPNGAGKSTLLRAVAGLHPYTGSITGGGHQVRAPPPRLLATRIAMVVQQPTIPVATTVADYVLLGRTAHLGWLQREGRRDRLL